MNRVRENVHGLCIKAKPNNRITGINNLNLSQQCAISQGYRLFQPLSV